MIVWKNVGKSIFRSITWQIGKCTWLITSNMLQFFEFFAESVEKNQIFCYRMNKENNIFIKEIQTKILSYRKSESADINRKWSGKFLMYTLRLISTSLSGSDILSLARDSFVARRLPYRFRRTYNIETIRQKAENSANGTAIDTINDVLS